MERIASAMRSNIAQTSAKEPIFNLVAEPRDRLGVALAAFSASSMIYLEWAFV